ncbi:hypothetical protein JOB18_001982 [Solea senegalensis]|uniref:Uncharacterized protein n=1 Tax=Solea senegalensis TaxID=28829 RepID=A0AAV6SIP4_SOLSE|nr:hypothetical protein JOB18_001982 [Solea senegalensis]
MAALQTTVMSGQSKQRRFDLFRGDICSQSPRLTRSPRCASVVTVDTRAHGSEFRMDLEQITRGFDLSQLIKGATKICRCNRIQI